MTRLMIERGHIRLPEGELIAFWRVDDPRLAGVPAIDGRTQQAIVAAIEAPDYKLLHIPALAIYAIESPDEPMPPWYDANDKQLQATVAEIARITAAKKRRDIEEFKRGVTRGQVIELPDATHYLVQSNQKQVLAAIEAFDRN